MDCEFKALFGVEPETIHKNCLLLPYIPPQISKVLGLEGKPSKGIIYKTISTPRYSVIITGMGCVFAADAVLYLKQTACKNALLFGSCGTAAPEKYPIGSVVLATRAIGCETLSHMLAPENTAQYPVVSAAAKLNRKILDTCPELPIVTALTVGSIMLEAGFMEKAPAGLFDIMEMELSAVYHAACLAEINATALAYVTDCPTSAPFYSFFANNNRKQVNTVVQNAANQLKNIIDAVF